MSAAGRWRADASAGVTVALVGLPQCLAYALVAGLPPAYGLATAVVPGAVAALVGRSAQIATGPTNTTGLLVFGALTPFLGANGLLAPDKLPVLATLTLLAGVIRLAVVHSGAGTLIRFLPESVLVGFTAGAATLIAAMQTDEALGAVAVVSSGLVSQTSAMVAAARAPSGLSAVAAAFSVATALAVVAGQRWRQAIPVSLIAVVVSGTVAWLFGWNGTCGLPLIAERAPVAAGWPQGAWPSLDVDLIESLFVPACAIVLLGTMELAVSARAGGARPDMTAEIRAQGWANTVGSFAAAFPASASLTRSALLRTTGAETPRAALVSAIVVVPAALFAGELLGHVPQATLAGVLLGAVVGMIDRRAIWRLYRASPQTRLLLLVTYVGTLVLPLEWAILFGAGLGLVIHLAQTSAPRLRLLALSGSGRLAPVAGEDPPALVVLEVSGDLHYAAVPPFLAEAERHLARPFEGVVLDLSHAHEVRFAALVAFERLAEQVESRGGSFWISGVGSDVAELVVRADSALDMMPADAEPGLSATKALGALQESRRQRG